MCGRFVQKRKSVDLTRLFRLTKITEAAKAWKARYNLSPTQNALVIRGMPDTERELTVMRWGADSPLVKEPGEYSTFNARAETLDTKTTFRSAFRHHREIIPSWKSTHRIYQGIRKTQCRNDHLSFLFFVF